MDNTGNHVANDDGSDPRSPYYMGSDTEPEKQCEGCHREYPIEYLILHGPSGQLECKECNLITCEYERLEYMEAWEKDNP